MSHSRRYKTCKEEVQREKPSLLALEHNNHPTISSLRGLQVALEVTENP